MSNHSDRLVILFRGGLLQTWDLNTKLPDQKGSKLRGGGKVAEPTLQSEKTLTLDGTIGRSLAVGPDGEIAVLSSNWERSLVTQLSPDHASETSEVDPTAERVIYSSGGKLVIAHSNGTYALCEPAIFPK